MNNEVLFYIICGVSAAVMLIYYLKRKHKVTSAVFGSMSGIAALLIANRFGGAVGAELPLNTFNVCGSAVLGAPFVAGMVIIKYI